MFSKAKRSSGASGHALVVGGSMAGLLAARVLADRFDRVTIVERDSFPDGPEFRKGVPQSRHTHVLMARGREILERLFPGLEGGLLDAGAVLIDSAEDIALLWPAGFAPRFRSGIPFLQSSRELLEFAVRERVASIPNVRFLQKTDVTGLLPAKQGEAVAGAKVRPREGGADEEILADLIVDASGRNSDASTWLEELGYEPPQETVVDAHLGYASRIYERSEDGGARDWKALLVQAAPPDVTRGGVLYPIEGGRWIAGLDGVGGDYPPTDEEGFMQFARSLRTPMLYDAIKEAKPLSPIRGYRATKNVRRHYEKLSHQPHNFLVTGDAACAFNPVYGQGMTTAAIGAETIEEALLERQDFAGLSGRFQRRLAKTTSAAWLLATGEDLRVRGVEGPPPDVATRLTNPYMDRVVELSLKDPAIYRTLLEVFHMTKPPTAMFGPSIAAKVLREALIGRGKNVLEMLSRLRPGSERDPKEAKAGSTDTETLGAANTG